ncbi:MAG: DUF393 domain-containing protein [Sphingomonadales bacterium]|nr:DUF393 domain-containing protein [Sphingomonadales bacterium]
MNPPTHPIILFDGDCNLCSWAVQFVLKRDKVGHFRFASLQSAAGQQIIREYGAATPLFETVLLVHNGQLSIASTAVLQILKKLPGGWAFLYCFILIPRPLRDLGYRIVSKTRYRIFGHRRQCLLSLPGWEDRFLI